MKSADSNRNAEGRPVWQSPKLQELGNIRRFVRSGEAKGKSNGEGDGNSDAGNEMMDHKD